MKKRQKNNKKKTIAIFTGYFLPHLGGVEQYTDSLSKELIRNGYKVIIITSNDNEYKSYEKNGNLSIYRLPILKTFKSRYPILNIFSPDYKKLKKKIINEEMNFIIANTRFYQTTYLGTKVAQKKGLEIYQIEHGSAHLTLSNKFLDFFVAIYEHFITRIIKNKLSGSFGVSNYAVEWLKHFNIEGIGVWYNSVVDDVDNAKIVKDDNKVIFSFVGRIIKQKGILNVIEAFQRIEKEFSNVKLEIAGNGELYEMLKEKNKSKNVTFYGKIDKEEVYAILKKSNVFLCPSIWPEGFPSTILEAGLMKNAVIATNQGGIKDIIKNERNGIIVKETADDLYRAMKELILDRKKTAKYANQLNIDVINNYTWTATGAKVIEFIESRIRND